MGHLEENYSNLRASDVLDKDDNSTNGKSDSVCDFQDLWYGLTP